MVINEPLSRPVTTLYGKEEIRLRLVGANGIGKTTLLEEYSGVDSRLLKGFLRNLGENLQNWIF